MQSSQGPDNKAPTWEEFTRQQSTGSSRCYVIKLADKVPLPDKTFKKMPFQCNSIYLRHQDKLYYINQVNKIYEEVKISPEDLTVWDKTLRPHDKAKPIAKRDLEIISPLMAGHRPPSEERRLEWYKLRLTEKRKGELQKQLDCKDKMSSEKISTLLAIQKKWKENRKKDTLVAVNLNGNHSEEFDELVHGQQVKKSINFDKLNKLEKALAAGNWSDDIFQDTHVGELALSLFASAKITHQQTITVLERVQTFKNYKYGKDESILDTDGQFTPFANEILLPALNGLLYPLTLDQIEEFRQLITKLPKSEQSCYTVDGSRHESYIFPGSRSLGGQLIFFEAIYYHVRSKNLLVLSAGLRDILGLVRFKKSYVPMRPTFGKKAPLEIEDGQRWPQKKRFGALRYRGTVPYQDVHDFEKFSTLTDAEATWHDVYHSNKMSILPLDIQNAILYLIDCVREAIAEDIPSPLTKEIWDWIDCDIEEKVIDNQLTSAGIIDYFLNSLVLNPNVNYITTTIHHRFAKNETILSTLGTILILSAIKNKEKWKTFNIDPDQLPPSNYLYPFYQDIKKIYPSLKGSPLKIQLIKIELYNVLKKNAAGEKHFTRLCELISANQDWMLKKTHFKKLKSDALKNRIAITYNGSFYITVRAIIEDLASKDETIGEAHKADYAHAILDLNYGAEETTRYIDLKKQKYNTNEAQFLVRPSLWKWIKCNKLASLFILPMLYGLYRAYEVRTLLPATAPTPAPATVAPSSALPSDVPPVLPPRPYEERVQKNMENHEKNEETWRNAKEKRAQREGASTIILQKGIKNI